MKEFVKENMVEIEMTIIILLAMVGWAGAIQYIIAIMRERRNKNEKSLDESGLEK